MGASSHRALYDVLTALGPLGERQSLLAVRRGLAGFRRFVALRVIPTELIEAEADAARFVAQVKAATWLAHPMIAAVYDIDAIDSSLCVALEFAPGATLAEVCEAYRFAHQPVPLGLVAKAIRDVAFALHYAHTFTDSLGRPRPFLHRMVTPRAIQLTFDGATKLLDLCLPVPTHFSAVERQQPSFFSPEQILGEELDVRSDIFSLAAVAHSVLTGSSYPYAELLRRAPSRTEFPPPSEIHPDATPELDAFLLRALYPSRERRYANAFEFARELERVVGGHVYRPDQTAAVLQRTFAARREQLKELITGEEERLTTQVMPLRSILQSDAPHANDETLPPRRSDTVPAMPTQGASTLPAATLPPQLGTGTLPPTGLEAAPRGLRPTAGGDTLPPVLASLDDVPKQGASGAPVRTTRPLRMEDFEDHAQGPSSSIAELDDSDIVPEESAEESAEERPRRRRGGRMLLKVAVAFTSFSLAIGIAAWVSDFEGFRGRLIDLVGNRLGWTAVATALVRAQAQLPAALGGAADAGVAPGQGGSPDAGSDASSNPEAQAARVEGASSPEAAAAPSVGSDAGVAPGEVVSAAAGAVSATANPEAQAVEQAKPVENTRPIKKKKRKKRRSPSAADEAFAE